MLKQLIYGRSLAEQLDKLVLYGMNRQVPVSLETSYQAAPMLDTVLAETQVNRQETAVYALTAPGEHTIWLDSPLGPLRCRVRVRLAADPTAPLLIYHPGFNELPYTSSWSRIFSSNLMLPFHTICIQAPYHERWGDPLTKGFASVASIFQIFAGSLRIMQVMQDLFEKEGAVHTVLAGISWGGITSVLHEGMFQRNQAVITMLSSPRLSLAMQGIAAMFAREAAIPWEEMQPLLDFTPFYEKCAPDKLFPLMGEYDLFFPLDEHETVFGERPLTKVNGGHITTMWQASILRDHIMHVMRQH
ncbi:MAG: hypothetical protein DWQ04_33795 [Chloroflexi bacterium]|nr:MAG: hypothetical protein DWQ04_33795 [Chloroflexota bacterium]